MGFHSLEGKNDDLMLLEMNFRSEFAIGNGKTVKLECDVPMENQSRVEMKEKRGEIQG